MEPGAQKILAALPRLGQDPRAIFDRQIRRVGRTVDEVRVAYVADLTITASSRSGGPERVVIAITDTGSLCRSSTATEVTSDDDAEGKDT